MYEHNGDKVDRTKINFIFQTNKKNKKKIKKTFVFFFFEIIFVPGYVSGCGDLYPRFCKYDDTTHFFMSPVIP